MQMPIGFPWYRREVYQDLRQLFVDGDRLPAAYDQWLQTAQSGASQIEAQGGKIVKVYVDPRHFNYWCQKRQLPMDFRARQQFAAAMALTHVARSTFADVL
jgi:hypothetical protein